MATAKKKTTIAPPGRIWDTSGEGIQAALPGPATQYVPPPVAPVYQPAAPPPTAPVAPPPKPLDYNALTLSDPEYLAKIGLIEQGHTSALKSLGDLFSHNVSSIQNNANAHGALFSGANVQGTQNEGTANTTRVGAENQNYLGNKGGLYWNVYNRLAANPPGAGSSDPAATAAPPAPVVPGPPVNPLTPVNVGTANAEQYNPAAPQNRNLASLVAPKPPRTPKPPKPRLPSIGGMGHIT